MDTMLFQAISRLSGRSFIVDKWMIGISNRMRYVFIFVLILLWFKNKKIPLRAILASSIALIMNTIIKLFIYKPRPFIKRRVGILIPSKMDSTFPSKHTLLAFAVSTTIFCYQRFLGALMLGLSFLTGLSRIFVGHHYPSDILGSAVIGSLSSMMVTPFSWAKSSVKDNG
ncbi:undecaprenyl-diphosphatase [Bacillus sp. RO3]|nr:undecaprenyl-diphosphatase [Bacillus sp. RO3]